MIKNLEGSNVRLKSDLASAQEQVKVLQARELPNVSRAESQRRKEESSLEPSPRYQAAKPLSYVPIRNRSVSNKRNKSPLPVQ